METTNGLKEELLALIRQAHSISADVGNEVQGILDDGLKNPLTQDGAERIIRRAISVLQRAAEAKGDTKTVEALSGKSTELVAQLLAARIGSPEPGGPVTPKPELVLQARNGIVPRPIFPLPCFHGREVPMNGGFVKTTDIALWDHNERLEIHLGQFRKKNGRAPIREEVLDIMLSKMDLPGLTGNDQFAIAQLARSIAINGVQKAPILDTNGVLLDGNRRVAACNFILNSDEFKTEQKQRAEYIFVWQLTEHALDEDRERVVVALNFEPDCKEDWPEYVKAKKLYEEWRSMLAVELRPPASVRQAAMKKELSMRYALGPNTNEVNRYLKMVDWANDFEEYHINLKKKDQYEVKHKANHYFQYFDELSKGAEKGVAYVLRQNDAFRYLVFDLLFEDKFKNWKQIRDLRFIHENDEALAQLQKARDSHDAFEAEECIDNAVNIAQTKKAEYRSVGANTRIEIFVKWLEELPVKSFRDDIRRENLARLQGALLLVDKQVKAVLEETGGAA